MREREREREREKEKEREKERGREEERLPDAVAGPTAFSLVSISIALRTLGKREKALVVISTTFFSVFSFTRSVNLGLNLPLCCIKNDCKMVHIILTYGQFPFH